MKYHNPARIIRRGVSSRLPALPALSTLLCAVLASCTAGPDPADDGNAFECRLVMNCAPFLAPDSLRVAEALLSSGGLCVALQFSSSDTLAEGSLPGLPSPLPPADLRLLFADDDTLELAFQPPQGQGDTLQLDLHLGYSVNSGQFSIESSWGGFSSPGAPSSVLFVGNSYTFANGGIAGNVDSLFSAMHPEWETSFGEYTVGGATLEDHFADPGCMMLVGSGSWELVVFQEQSLRPIEEPSLMWEYAFLLDSAVTAAGGESSFFMTWPREYDTRSIRQLEYAYDFTGASLDASVAPVGLAWMSALSLDPDLDLWEDDQSHPTIAGTYLAACVFYSLLASGSPAGASYVPDGIDPDEAALLQEVAWETVSSRAPVDWHWF